MRIVRRYHVLLLLLLAIALWLAWPQTFLLKQAKQGGIEDRALLNASYSSIAYKLDRSRWTTFPVNPKLQPLRIITNATLPAAAAKASKDVEWKYALQIQFLDQEGNVLRDHVHYFRSHVTWYKDERFDYPVSASFYLDPAIRPTDGRISFFSLRSFPKVRSIRVRTALADPGIYDVVLRVYAPEMVPDYNLSAAWAHLSIEQRRSLARGNVYDLDLLTEEERKNLVRKRWTAIGPTGVSGVDYVSRKIYTLRVIKGKEIAPPVPPFGLFVSPDRHGVIPIPSGGGRLRLEFAAVKGDTLAGKVRIRWTDPGERITRTFVGEWSKGGYTFEENVEEGLIEIESPRVGAVRAFLTRPDEEEVEITPQYPYLPIYLTGDHPVVFDVHHVNGLPTEMRFDVRRIWIQGMQSACSGVEYRLMDRDGHVLAEGTLEAPTEPSRYDILTGLWEGNQISDARRNYLWLPASAVRVEFHSLCPMAINAYDRPADFFWLTRVPQDYDVSKTLALEKRVPGWFSVKPLNLKDLLFHNRIPLIQIQVHPRPVEEIQALMSGKYYWTDYKPEAASRGRWLLVPRESPLPPRKQSLAGFYLRMKNGMDREVLLDSEAGVFRPNLIFTRAAGGPGHVSLWLDGKPYASFDIFGKNGEVRLPPIQAGRHRLRLQSDEKTTCFISNANAMEDVFVKRFVYPLTEKTLRFVIEKGPEEAEKVVAARLFTPVGRSSTSTVRVRILGAARPYMKPLPGWTFVNRRFVISPPELPQSALVLGKSDMYMDAGQSFFIPLRADLAPGKYTIEVALEGGHSGYIALTNVLPGEYEERRIVQEAAIENAVAY